MCETGKGFPDIHTIEPLANALGLSVLEIMRAEKAENSHNTDIAEALQTAVWLGRENRKQEQTALGIAVFTTIVAAVLFYLAGFGNLGGSIAFGAIVSVAETAVYYYLENREDAESRTINAIIGTIAVILIGVLLIISIR